MLRFAITVFLSALLLFQVQPLLGKTILPWFGGSPAVWTTCMLLFQWLLLAGYGYAHWTSSQLRPRVQGALHLGLLTLSLLWLPIIPDASWKPTGDQSPTWSILLLLSVTIGLPYFTLSATGPLLQSWFSRANPGRSPYRLYALSNFGSLLALLSYPLAIEPAFTLNVQAWLWSAGYAVFALSCGWCAWRLLSTSALNAGTATVAAAKSSPARSRGTIAYWLALSTCGSVMLLATTNQLCQEVAVAPFLWILPLAIYLISFILTFDSDRWYRPGVFGLMLGGAAILTCLVIDSGPEIGLIWQIGILCSALFAATMVCHGELARARPDTRQLTLFYLIIATGGAMGGMLVAIVAPAIFTGYWEYHLGLAACCVMGIVARRRDIMAVMSRRLTFWNVGVLLAGAFVVCISLGKHVLVEDGLRIDASRNFYGVLRVRLKADETGAQRITLAHGRIIHGSQFVAPERRRWPTSYYGPTSGVGVAIDGLRERPAASAERPLRIGVIGLGAGTVATYGRPGDVIRFYEINAEVIRMAQDHFTFLSDTPAQCELVLGDARLQLERELAEGASSRFDLLVVDAFSGDAVPMHLLTRECLDVYLNSLAPDGVIALHVSNLNVDLKPVIRGLAAERQCDCEWVQSAYEPERGTNLSDWVLVTPDRSLFMTRAFRQARRLWPDDAPAPLVWTDDFGSLRQVLASQP